MRTSGLFHRERVFFVCIVGCALLLVSLVTLRSELASEKSARVFRDGFIVANRNPTIRRIDMVKSQETKTPCVLPEATSSSSSSSSKKPGKAIELVGGGHRTTTIKTEDGDEITIKRVSTNKNKITRISADEDGKITIENHDHEESKDKNTSEGTKSLAETNGKATDKGSDREKYQRDVAFNADGRTPKSDSNNNNQHNQNVVRVNMDSKPRQKSKLGERKDPVLLLLENDKEPQKESRMVGPDNDEEEADEADADHVVVHLSRNLNHVTIQEVKEEPTMGGDQSKPLPDHLQEQ